MKTQPTWHSNSDAIFDSKGNRIANVVRQHTGQETSRICKVLAAAPDLLAACKAILEATDFDPTQPLSVERNRMIADAQGKLQEAIAKAEGDK